MVKNTITQSKASNNIIEKYLNEKGSIRQSKANNKIPVKMLNC